MSMETTLAEFFEQFLMARGISLTSENLLDFNFVGSGLLDSFEILSMIMEVETQFSLKLSPEELTDNNNATVGGLIRTLVTKN